MILEGKVKAVKLDNGYVRELDVELTDGREVIIEVEPIKTEAETIHIVDHQAIAMPEAPQPSIKITLP